MGSDQIFVIVGASLAGAKAAETLREEGFTGRVVLVGEEAERPYERPPLSKGLLLGKDDKQKIYVHDEDWYDKHSVELWLRRRAASLHRDSRELELDDGERIHYTKLLLTTGASARRLDVPGFHLDGVLYLRRVEDSERLRQVLRGAGPVVVVGAGWIGLEVAAAARQLDCQVTVIEPRPTPLSAALGPEMGGYFADLHRRYGVDLRLGSGVSELRGDAGRVTAVLTDDGTQIPAEVVIVGVGATPNTELAEQAGLPVDNGVLVDQSLRTDDPDVYAAGDVANAVHPLYEQRLRVEHWGNALHQGSAAAKAMLGRHVAYDRIPYFFTDQYEVGMEFTGWFPPGGYDTVLTRGDAEGNAFYAFWLADDRLVAGMHVNLWDDGIRPVQELVRSGKAVDSRRLADPSVPLPEVVRH